ncbi:uncharacterized protein [Panulirus ornatus]|uniref:uncharacterized protein isoform X1 n=1 Tax=Panulirus ornatus TaxID=150431 RepID=UPI003A8506AE
MEGPEVREVGSGPHWVRLEWGDQDLHDASTSSDPTAGPASGHASPAHPATPRGGDGGGRVGDSYEHYLALAYAKDCEPDPFLQDEDGLEEGPLEEEIDRTEVFPERPTHVFTLQLLHPRTGWTNIYRGSGWSYVVEGLAPAQVAKVRVRETQGDLHSPWVILTVKTKSVPGTSHDLLEAVKEDNATLVRDVLAELLKFSQIERMDHVVELGHTPLVAAVAAGSRDAVAVLLERRAALGAATAGPQVTPLILAAWLGRGDLVRRLRAAGASWNHPDRNGLTALHYGVAASQLELVKAALQDGADPTLPAAGHSTLILALIAAHMRLTSGKWSREEAEEEAMKMVEALVEGGAEVDQRDAGGNTALHVAIILGLAPLARKLASAGGDGHLVNGRGYTPTHLAHFSGHSLDKSTPRDQDLPPLGELEALAQLMKEELPHT